MRHDSGESAEEVAQGYNIKLGHIEDGLQKIGMQAAETFAFEASADDPDDITTFILEKIGSGSAKPRPTGPVLRSSRSIRCCRTGKRLSP